jgi:hypothetical protein
LHCSAALQAGLGCQGKVSGHSCHIVQNFRTRNPHKAPLKRAKISLALQAGSCKAKSSITRFICYCPLPATIEAATPGLLPYLAGVTGSLEAYTGRPERDPPYSTKAPQHAWQQLSNIHGPYHTPATWHPHQKEGHLLLNKQGSSKMACPGFYCMPTPTASWTHTTTHTHTTVPQAQSSPLPCSLTC